MPSGEALAAATRRAAPSLAAATPRATPSGDAPSAAMPVAAATARPAAGRAATVDALHGLAAPLAGGLAAFDPAALAALVNEALVEQARLHGVDIQ